MPKISVITASYNYENYIKETIQSVIDQTYTDWEMLVVDDGSKDNSVGVIKSYCEKDSRVKLLQHENGINKGLIETLKLGIKKAQGEWIVFLESDDTITLNYLEKKLKVAQENPDVEMIFNDVNLFGEEEAVKIMQNNMEDFHKIIINVKTQKDYVKWFRKLNLVPTFSAVMVKKELMENADFNANVTQWIDYYLWSQFAPKYKMLYIPEKLTNWRMHKSSYNNNRTKFYEGVTFVDIAIRDNLSQGKYKLWHRICAIPLYIRAFKRKFIRIHPKDNEIIFMGKSYKIKKGN